MTRVRMVKKSRQPRTIRLARVMIWLLRVNRLWERCHEGLCRPSDEPRPYPGMARPATPRSAPCAILLSPRPELVGILRGLLGGVIQQVPGLQGAEVHGGRAPLPRVLREVRRPHPG